VAAILDKLLTLELKSCIDAATVILNCIVWGDDEDIRSLIDLGCIEKLCKLLVIDDNETVFRTTWALERVLETGKERSTVSKKKVPKSDPDSVSKSRDSNSFDNLWAQEVQKFNGIYFILKIIILLFDIVIQFDE